MSRFMNETSITSITDFVFNFEFVSFKNFSIYIMNLVVANLIIIIVDIVT